MEGVLLLFFVGIVVFGGWMRLKLESMRHKERLAMLEKGIPPPARPNTGSRYLRSGLLFLLLGVSTSVFLTAVAYGTRERFSEERKYHHLQGMRKDEVPEDVIRKVEQEMNESFHYMIDPAAGFVGVIPTIVGIACLILYRLDQQDQESRGGSRDEGGTLV